MASNENRNLKKPGEKEAGKFHYNPGNQSGKTVENIRPEPEQETDVDPTPTRGEQHDRKR